MFCDRRKKKRYLLLEQIIIFWINLWRSPGLNTFLLASDGGVGWYVNFRMTRESCQHNSQLLDFVFFRVFSVALGTNNHRQINKMNKKKKGDRGAKRERERERES